jgi:hypothetical protein
MNSNARVATDGNRESGVIGDINMAISDVFVVSAEIIILIIMYTYMTSKIIGWRILAYHESLTIARATRKADRERSRELKAAEQARVKEERRREREREEKRMAAEKIARAKIEAKKQEAVAEVRRQRAAEEARAKEGARQTEAKSAADRIRLWEQMDGSTRWAAERYTTQLLNRGYSNRDAQLYAQQYASYVSRDMQGGEREV